MRNTLVPSPAALFAGVILLGACGRPGPAAPGDLRSEAEAFLAHGAAAWNRGDLTAFLGDYLPGARTTFVTGTGVVRDTAAIRARYAARFAPGATRDSLAFRTLDVDLLAPGVAHVVAVYVLTRGDSVTAEGPTSLVLVRRGGRWRIVHDHSS